MVRTRRTDARRAAQQSQAIDRRTARDSERPPGARSLALTMLSRRELLRSRLRDRLTRRGYEADERSMRRWASLTDGLRA